jgi:glucosylceramidase
MTCGYRTFTGWNLMLDETGGPNIGPFMCGGLVTRNSQDGALTYSGQYVAFSHVSRYIRPDARIYPISVDANEKSMTHYPKASEGVVGVAAENPDGSFVLLLSNHNTDKRQLQFERDGVWYYLEMTADSVCTVLVED